MYRAPCPGRTLNRLPSPPGREVNNGPAPPASAARRIPHGRSRTSPHRGAEARQPARDAPPRGGSGRAQDADHRLGAAGAAPGGPADRHRGVQHPAERPAGSDPLPAFPRGQRRGHGGHRDFLEGALRGARGRGHRTDPLPCALREADQGQEERCGRQPVAGPHLPVRPVPAQLRAAARVPPAAAAEPLSPQAGEGAEPRAQPGPRWTTTECGWAGR